MARRHELDSPGDDPAWIRCQSCEGYWCLIHGEHAETCPCPPVEQWVGLTPYQRGSREDGVVQLLKRTARMAGIDIV